MAYITQAEFEYAISPIALRAFLDDDNDGLVDAVVVTAYINRASALTDAWISPVYAGPFPIVQMPVPAMIRELTIQYIEAMVYERKPELARSDATDGPSSRWARADAMGERLQKAILRINELPAPANVGGQVRRFGAALGSDDIARIFDDMGSF